MASLQDQLLSQTGGNAREAAGPPEKEGDLLRAEGVVKSFPGIWTHLILDHINFDVHYGEVHALLGENGAGKTVLANILSGFYSHEGGKIFYKGRPVTIRNPKDAIKLGIGMAHQELTLIRPFSVAENIAIGLKGLNFSFPIAEVERKVGELSQKYGLKIDPKARVEEVSGGEQQRVEVLRALFFEPEVLILDEPTSMLTPAEAEGLFFAILTMAREGKGIVFITHRLEEVMKVANRVTVLRLGKLVGTKSIYETSRDELVRMMIGETALPRLERIPRLWGKVVLQVRDLYLTRGAAQGKETERDDFAVKDLSFSVREGEIFAVAGVAGNGQKELVEAITGLRKVARGNVLMFGRDMTNQSPGNVANLGVSHIPEERTRMGIAGGLPVVENMMMRDYRLEPFSNRILLRRGVMTEHTKKMIAEYEIMVPNLWETESRILSGGNIQRLILARELWREPPLIIAVHPTYGLDLRAIKHTHTLLMNLRKKGSAILLVSEDLDEVMALGDQIAVMFEGDIIGIVDGRTANREEIGRLMAGSVGAT